MLRLQDGAAFDEPAGMREESKAEDFALLWMLGRGQRGKEKQRINATLNLII